MKFKDQGPFGHWHEQYESIDNFDKIDWISRRIQEVMSKYLSHEVLYGGGHHIGKTEAARALRNQFALETAARYIKTFFNLPEEYQGHIQHILRDFQDAITPRTEEVYLTFAEKVDPFNGKIIHCLHRIEDSKGQEISPGRWIENHPVTRWRTLALKVQR